jgi:hypothetical protein
MDRKWWVFGTGNYFLCQQSRGKFYPGQEPGLALKLLSEKATTGFSALF